MGKTKKASKANWKKINHPDVEEFLEDEREKERHNFGNASDSSLFILDTGRQPKAVADTNNVESEDKLVDFSKLKCFQIFKSSSTVADPVVKRNKLRIASRVKRRKFGPTPKKEEQGLIDPWSDTEQPAENDWLDEKTIKRQKGITKKKREENKTTELKAIDMPHPGHSVNPTFQDHQNLLREALDVELKAIKREKKLNRATEIPRTATTGEHDPMVLQALMKDEPEDVKEEEEESEDDKKPILTKPKTKKQRRNEKKEHEMQNSAKEKKKTKQLESEVYNIKQIRQELDAEESKRKSKLLKKISGKLHHEKFGQKALSQHKFEPSKLNPMLSDELTGRLVEVKSTSSLLLDRFKSFQKRNILEVRVKQRMKRVNKLKRYERPSEKMEWEKTGVWNGFKLKH